MSLVTTAELAAFLNTTITGGAVAPAQAALDIAEQQVSVVLGFKEADGLGLARRTGVVKTFYVPVDADALEVPTGPLELLSTVEIDDVSQTIGASGVQIMDAWTIRFDPPTGKSFSKGSRIELTANVGYIASGSPGTVIPAAVKNAVLIQASALYSNLSALASGQVKTGESIGDYSVSYAASASAASNVVSPLLPSLLMGIRRAPQLGA